MVSILTLNKNRHKHLYAMIEGIKRNNMAPQEVIIIDMSDEPANCDGGHLNLRHIHYPVQKLLLAKARNIAAQFAKSEKLIFLDVDCIAASNFIETMADALDKYGNVISSQVLYLPQDGLPNPQAWEEKQLKKIGKAHPVRNFPPLGFKVEENPGLFWSLAFAVTKTTFREIGGFCEDYIGYGAEDTDFGFRSQKKGFKNYFTAQTYCFHQYHEVSDPPIEHLSDIVQNARTFYHKWGFWPMEGWLEEFSHLGLIKWDKKSENIDLI